MDSGVCPMELDGRLVESSVLVTDRPSVPEPLHLIFVGLGIHRMLSSQLQTVCMHRLSLGPYGRPPLTQRCLAFETVYLPLELWSLGPRRPRYQRTQRPREPRTAH